MLPLRQFDETFGLTRQFAVALEDRRYQPFVDHALVEMVRMRVYGILADYEDQNDHSALGSDPMFKLIAGRFPDDDDRACKVLGQPRSTQRYAATADSADERRLVARLDELVRR